MDTTQLLEQIRAIDARRLASSGPGGWLFAQGGFETRLEARHYDWDGMKRAAANDAPVAVVQYTLAGEGAYEQGGRTWKLGPGDCFAALIPSAHRYYLPVQSAGWTFFFLYLRHDYAVQRFAKTSAEFGPVVSMPPDAAPTMRMVDVFESLTTASFRDDLAAEQAILDFTLEYARFARGRFYPSIRPQLLEDVRQYVLAHLARNIAVEELADHAGMSRSHYSHYFHDATGLSPAAYITQIRMDEVIRRLTQTRQSLKQMARETGFADANHLCKVFRRQFQTSPGRFRQRLFLPGADVGRG